MPIIGVPTWISNFKHVALFTNYSPTVPNLSKNFELFDFCVKFREG